MGNREKNVATDLFHLETLRAFCWAKGGERWGRGLQTSEGPGK